MENQSELIQYIFYKKKLSGLIESAICHRLFNRIYAQIHVGNEIEYILYSLKIRSAKGAVLLMSSIPKLVFTEPASDVFIKASEANIQPILSCALLNNFYAISLPSWLAVEIQREIEMREAT